MEHTDLWQAATALAGITYTVGNIHQVRLTLKTRKTDGLSLPQWQLFLGASVAVSGKGCCATLAWIARCDSDAIL